MITGVVADVFGLESAIRITAGVVGLAGLAVSLRMREVLWSQRPHVNLHAQIGVTLPIRHLFATVWRAKLMV